MPVFAGAPMQKSAADSAERNAMLLMTYFHPWTAISTHHCIQVPHVEVLKSADQSWVEAREEWQRRGVVCEEALHHATNFVNMSRTRVSNEAKGKR